MVEDLKGHYNLFFRREKEKGNITIEKGICDSCNDPSDVLFPIVVLDELPTGGMGMVRRYYCYSCYEDICEEAETNNKEKDEDEEDSPIDPINSGKCLGHNMLTKRIFNLYDYTGVNW